MDARTSTWTCGHHSGRLVKKLGSCGGSSFASGLVNPAPGQTDRCLSCTSWWPSSVGWFCIYVPQHVCRQSQKHRDDRTGWTWAPGLPRPDGTLILAPWFSGSDRAWPTEAWESCWTHTLYSGGSKPGAGESTVQIRNCLVQVGFESYPLFGLWQTRSLVLPLFLWFAIGDGAPAEAVGVFVFASVFVLVSIFRSGFLRIKTTIHVDITRVVSYPSLYGVTVSAVKHFTPLSPPTLDNPRGGTLEFPYITTLKPSFDH